MKRKFLDNHSLRHTLPFAAACFTVGLTLFACADKDVETNDNNGKALVTFNVSAVQSKAQDQAKAAAKAGLPMTRAAFANQLALQNLAPEDLTMQKLPVQGAAASSDICLIETTVPGVPSQWEDGAPTRANITTMPTMQNFSTTAFYGSSDTSLAPWFYDKDTKKDGTLVTPIYWDWVKTHGCFYAVYPKPDNSKIKLSPASHTGTPYVDFEVEPNVTNQKDLMTACSGNVHTDIGTMSATAPRTDLTFRHALTAVRFKVGQNLSWNKTITKVEIIGAKSKGRYTLSSQTDGTGAQWSNLDAPTTFALGGDGTVNVSTSQAVNQIIMGNTGDNYTFYMIPQPLAGVSVKIYFSDGSTPITATLTGRWKPGTTKTYALSQNTSTWNYVLTVSNPAAAAYTETTAASYTVQSYRTAPDGTQQPVAWKVVSYQESADGGANFGTETTDKPAWLTALSNENGTGSTYGEYGTATLKKAEVIDHLAPYNKVLREATPKGSAGNPYNLSNAIGAAAIQNTANSYLISAPGYYRIPLVYGNAIKNSTTNEHSYKTSNTGYEILTNFKDHNDNNITSPYINVQNGSDPATQAAIVWTDQNGLVDGLSVTNNGANSYVNFHVPADKIKNGNAVIAVKNASGTVMWSWHLWFDHSDVLNTIACTNYQGYTYNFTKQTLGFAYRKWDNSTYDKPRVARVKVEQTIANGGTKRYAYIDITQNPGSVKEISSTYYQFGRKDALPGTDAIAQGSYSFDNTSGGRSLGHAIQHPENMFIYARIGNNYWDWCNATYFNLWSANNTVTSHNDNPVVKTVYDPCPAGFHMPASNAFTGFTTNGWNNGPINVSGAWDMGWNFKAGGSSTATVYFPASGQRSFYTGSLGGVGGGGTYWSAVPYGSGVGCHLDFDKQYVHPQYSFYRSMGFSVRPVAE